MPGLNERFELRLDEVLLASIDKWREEQGGMPSRAQAIRLLVEKGLDADRPSTEFNPTGGERLVLTMLADIYERVVGNGEIDPEFVKSVLWSSNAWGMGWQYPGLLHGENVSDAVVEEVAGILEMWRTLEFSFDNLSDKQKAEVAKELGEKQLDVRFDGFDGNLEAEHYSVAHFMIKDLKRFETLAARELNSHRPTLPGYRQMRAVYRRFSRQPRLAPSAIVEILTVRRG